MQVRDITEQDFEEIAAELRDLPNISTALSDRSKGLHLVHTDGHCSSVTHRGAWPWSRMRPSSIGTG